MFNLNITQNFPYNIISFAHIFRYLLLSLYYVQYFRAKKNVAQKRDYNLKGQVPQLHAAILDMQANIKVYLYARPCIIIIIFMERLMRPISCTVSGPFNTSGVH